MPPRKPPAEFSLDFKENKLPDVTHTRRVMACPLMSELEQENFCCILESERGQMMTDEQLCEEAGINYGHFVTTYNSAIGALFRQRVEMIRAAHMDNLGQVIRVKTAQHLTHAPELTMEEIASAAAVYERLNRVQEKKRSHAQTPASSPAGFIPGPSPAKLNHDAPRPAFDGTRNQEGHDPAAYTIEDELFDGGEGRTQGNAG